MGATRRIPFLSVWLGLGSLVFSHHGPLLVCLASAPPPPPSSATTAGASGYEEYPPRPPPSSSSGAANYGGYDYHNNYNNNYNPDENAPYPPETGTGEYQGWSYNDGATYDGPGPERMPPPPQPPSSSSFDRQGYYGGNDSDAGNPFDRSTTGAPGDGAPEAAKQPVPKAPIHYEFPAAASDENEDEEKGDRRTEDGGVERRESASARTDLVTRYMSSTTGKLKVWTMSGIVGGSTGIVLSKTIIPLGSDLWWGALFATVFEGSSILLRTPLGELTRALALSVILVLEKSSRIRKTYPTWPYILPALTGGGNNNRRGRRRRPFPPARNPWKYAPRRPGDAEFNMLYTLIAMAMVGSTCGGNLPMVPTWIGSLSGAAIFAFACTLTGNANSPGNPRGDLFRTMGMRVVAMVQELWEIQAQLGIVPKAAVVSGQAIDRLMILDKQHKVKDRFLSVINSGYDRAMQTASRIQDQRLETQGRRGRGDGDGGDDDRASESRRPSRFPRGLDGEDDSGRGRSRDGRRGERRPPGPNERGPRRDGDDRPDYNSDPRRRETENWRSNEEYGSEKDSADEDASSNDNKKRGWFRR